MSVESNVGPLRLLLTPFDAHPDVEVLIEHFPEAERSAGKLQREKFQAFGEAVAHLTLTEKEERGTVLLFSGPMRSGKSHLGLAVAEFYEQNVGSTVRFVKPAVDERDATMASHNGCASKSCHAIEGLSDEELLADDYLVVDEYQFLEPGQRERLDNLIRQRASQGKHSIICMLNRDFRGAKWDNYENAKGIVQELEGKHFKLHSICECCGGIAGRTQREVNVEGELWRPARYDEPVISVEVKDEPKTPERYSARCRDCHEVAPAFCDAISP